MKRTIVGLVERGGKVRTFHVQHATKASVCEILVTNADRASKLYTDEPNLYPETGKEFADHRTVKHSAKEYGRFEDGVMIHTNTIENVSLYSSVAWSASTSIAARLICPATLPSLASAITAAPHSRFSMQNARRLMHNRKKRGWILSPPFGSLAYDRAIRFATPLRVMPRSAGLCPRKEVNLE